MKAAFFFCRLSLALIFLFLSACGQAATELAAPTTVLQPPAAGLPSATFQAPAATLRPEATKTLSPNNTPIPSFTPRPTATTRTAAGVTATFQTPAEGLKTTGPYLIYIREGFNICPFCSDEKTQPTTLRAIDEDGSGQMTIPLPNQGYITDLLSSASPDGKWIAYYTGSPVNADTNGKYSFALHVYQWQTGQDRKVTDLLSSDYPNNFQKTADMLHTSDPKRWEGLDLLQNLKDTFIYGMFRPKWSPDGRYLAFAGEKDGPSSDVYLYILHTGEIRRLSDGPANIQWMRWTPDSQKVLHYSAYNLCEGECGAYHVAQIDGKVWTLEHVDSYGGENFFAGWVSNNQMALYSHTNGPYGPLRYLNIDTGEDVIYFHDSVMEAFYDPAERLWLVTDPNPDHESYQPGLYLVEPKTKSEKWISPTSCRKVNFLGYQDQRFIAYCGEDFDHLSLLIIHQDGSISEPLDGPIKFSQSAQLSPDKHWYMIGDPQGERGYFYTRLYGMDWKVKDEFEGYPVKDIAWRPDSAGLFFTSLAVNDVKKGLYHFSLADHQVKLIDASMPDGNDDNGFPYLWTQ